MLNSVLAEYPDGQLQVRVRLAASSSVASLGKAWGIANMTPMAYSLVEPKHLIFFPYEGRIDVEVTNELKGQSPPVFPFDSACCRCAGWRSCVPLPPPSLGLNFCRNDVQSALRMVLTTAFSFFSSSTASISASDISKVTSSFSGSESNNASKTLEEVRSSDSRGSITGWKFAMTTGCTDDIEEDFFFRGFGNPPLVRRSRPRPSLPPLATLPFSPRLRALYPLRTLWVLPRLPPDSYPTSDSDASYSVVASIMVDGAREGAGVTSDTGTGESCLRSCRSEGTGWFEFSIADAVLRMALCWRRRWSRKTMEWADS
mmetsp:Transcript_39301/g.83895  ORF Transcript_39301/g.83895 Transcript_39301/m.83895 type:complete len:315 (-) Transcript_39301:276-1220(-)